MDVHKDRLDAKVVKQQIEESLQINGIAFTGQDIDSIIDKFGYLYFFDNILADQYYLDIFKRYVKEIDTIRFTRYQYYEHIINVETPRDHIQNLTKFAIVMESRQTNKISLNDYQTLLKDLGADSLLKQTDNLISLKLLKKETQEDGGETIGFYHPSLQEFLVARDILSKKDPLTTLRSLVLIEQDNVVAIKSSWFNVIRFLFETPHIHDIIHLLLDVAGRNPQNLTEQYVNAIVGVDPNKISPEIRDKIFELVYHHYQETQLWISMWARSRMWIFCNEHFYKLLKGNSTDNVDNVESYVKCGNDAMILAGLFKNNSPLVFNDEEYWREKAIEWSLVSLLEYYLLQSYAFDILATFKDDALIQTIAKQFEFEKKDELVQESFIEFCKITNPNNPASIDIFVQGTKSKRSIAARYGIYEINTPGGILHLLDAFCEDKEFLDKFIDLDSIFNSHDKEKDQIIFDNVKKAMDSSEDEKQRILDRVKNIISKLFADSHFYYQESIFFVRKLIELIRDNDNTYVVDVLNRIKTEANGRGHRDRSLLIASLINDKNAGEVTHAMKDLPQSDQRYICAHLKRTSLQLYEQVVKPLGLKKEPIQNDSNEEGDFRNTVEERFKEDLEPEPGEKKFMTRVFETYNNNKEKLHNSPYMDRFKKLVTESGMDVINPRKFVVKYEGDPGQGPYTISQAATYYGDVVQSAINIFGKEYVQKYRQSIIDDIPFMFSDEYDSIFLLFDSITESDLVWVNEVMRDPKSHIRYFHPSAYLYILKTYIEKGCDLRQTIETTVKSFIEDEKQSEDVQDSALELYGAILNKKDTAAQAFIHSLFSKYENQPEHTRIAELANKLLISIFHDSEAIKWRLNKILSDEGINESDRLGIERKLSFAMPIIELADLNLQDKIKDIFKKSTELNAKNGKNEGLYLQSVVYSYFESLSKYKSLIHYFTLEKWVKEVKTTKETRWWNWKLELLWSRCVEEIGKEIKQNKVLIIGVGT